MKFLARLDASAEGRRKKARDSLNRLRSHGCATRLSAFGLMYLLAFAVTLGSVLILALGKSLGFGHDFAPKSTANSGVITAILWVLVLVLGLHLTRIYVSLEMLDSDHDFLAHVLNKTSLRVRVVELALRTLAAFVVAMKGADFVGSVLNLSRIGESSLKWFFGYLIALYAVLLTWDVFMRVAASKKDVIFLLPDSLGLVSALSMFLALGFPPSWLAPFVVLAFVCAITMGFLLLGDFYVMGDIYIEHVKLKWGWLTSSKCDVSEVIPPPAGAVRCSQITETTSWRVP